MNLTLIAFLSAVFLFILMLVFFEFGRRIGKRRLSRDPEGLAKGIGAAEGAVFGLLGLILAFTFSGAATRFEERRHLITQEANAIGTAYLRIDLLPADAQPEIRAMFRDYLDLRTSIYSNSGDDTKTKAKTRATEKLQRDIWLKVLADVEKDGGSNDSTKLLLPALNDMIDITTTREMATRNHPPLVVFLLLAGLSLTGAMLVGYDMSPNKDRSWFHSISFAAIISLACYVIIDLEFPRMGLIRVDGADQVFVDLQKSMN